MEEEGFRIPRLSYEGEGVEVGDLGWEREEESYLVRE